MSVGPLLDLAEADALAGELHDMLAPHAERFEIAGSVRRRAPQVHDIEAVFIPKLVRRAPEGELIEQDISAVWAEVDRLCWTGALHRYTDPTGAGGKWGEIYRAAELRGVRVDLYAASVDNFGSKLAIRTGPAGFSAMLMAKLKQGGRLHHKDGFVRYQRGGEIVPAREERDFFGLCHVDEIAPELRGQVAEACA